MDAKEFAKKIENLDEKQLGALAKSLADGARSGARAAAEVYWKGDEDAADSAQIVLSEMEETAILPLIGPEPPPAANQRVWVLEAAVDAELALRRKVMKRLEKALDDKTPLADRSQGPSERKPPKRRVCDQAYLLMRRIIHAGDEAEKSIVQEDLFLNMPDDFKDAQIREARRSGQWIRAITGKEIEEYEQKEHKKGTLE